VNCDEAYYIASSDNDGDERWMGPNPATNQGNTKPQNIFYEINYKKSLEKIYL
jgi:hypothetical protein